MRNVEPMSIDILIIGAGPAGLQAALTVGRLHRKAVVMDSGQYRNATVSHMHNVAGFDGTPPAEFRAQAISQLSEYPTVELRESTVERVERVDEDVFDAHLSDQSTIRAKAVILATGVRDELPDVPGLAEAWGHEVAQCPFCHGHEFAGQPIGLMLGDAAPHLAAMLQPVASELVVFDNGTELASETKGALEALDARVVPGALESVARGDGLTISTGGETVQVAGLFVAPRMLQAAPFAEQLGLELNPSGAIRIDVFGHTSVPGVYAAGDAAHHPDLPMPMASVIQSLAHGQTAGATAIKERG